MGVTTEQWDWLHSFVDDIYTNDLWALEFPADYTRENAERAITWAEEHDDTELPAWWDERWHERAVSELEFLMGQDVDDNAW